MMAQQWVAFEIIVTNDDDDYGGDRKNSFSDDLQNLKMRILMQF